MSKNRLNKDVLNSYCKLTDKTVILRGRARSGKSTFVLAHSAFNALADGKSVLYIGELTPEIAYNILEVRLKVAGLSLNKVAENLKIVMHTEYLTNGMITDEKDPEKHKQFDLIIIDHPYIMRPEEIHHTDALISFWQDHVYKYCSENTDLIVCMQTNRTKAEFNFESLEFSEKYKDFLRLTVCGETFHMNYKTLELNRVEEGVN